MKLSNILVGLALLLGVIFGFVLLFQKQKNDHTEKMVVQLTNHPTKQSVLTLPVAQDQKTRSQKIKDGVQSMIAFVFGVFNRI
jgi:hypothetical protein